jgi:hypothetical protein
LDAEKDLTHKPGCTVRVRPAMIPTCGKSLRRYFHIEREFHLVTERLADCADAADLSELSDHRDAIILEARGILHELDIWEPTWCFAK